ncbi:Nn.00g049580.m01.CDS01 [Neocucurbitaria sp. VM-36]
MSTQSPTIHVLEKANYSRHRLVALPTESLPPLAPSSLRLRPKILSLTTNNLTYARLGHLMGWYDIYPLPANTPAPYNNSEVYGRISAWGYAEIIESTVPEITSGKTVYGYLPISTGVEDVRIEFAEHNGKPIPDQIVVLDEHRQHLWKVYNRYQIRAPLSSLENREGKDSLGWDSLMQLPFATGYNLSTFAFAWEDRNRIHPSGTGGWSASDTDLCDATVVILNASGKTGMSFAYNLRHSRPTNQQPKTIIGIGSPASVSTIEQSGLYDKAVLNSDAETTASDIEKAGTRRVVYLDFGGRVGANDAWKVALTSISVPFTLVTVGGEVEIQNPEKARARLANRDSLRLVNASLLREKGIEVGGEKYFDDFHKAFDEFKTRIVGMQLRWAEGMEEWEKGWDAFVRDEVRANTGLVYRI